MKFETIKTVKLDTYGIQKSFPQALVHVCSNGEEALLSYDTIVASYDGKGFHRHWNAYSATTMKHINAFRIRHGLPKIGKKEWEGIKTEEFKW